MLMDCTSLDGNIHLEYNIVNIVVVIGECCHLSHFDEVVRRAGGERRALQMYVFRISGWHRVAGGYLAPGRFLALCR